MTDNVVALFKRRTLAPEGVEVVRELCQIAARLPRPYWDGPFKQLVDGFVGMSEEDKAEWRDHLAALTEANAAVLRHMDLKAARDELAAFREAIRIKYYGRPKLVE